MKYAKQAPDRVVLKSDKNKAESIALVNVHQKEDAQEQELTKTIFEDPQDVISVDSPLLDTFVALSSVDTFVLPSLVDIPVDLLPGG